jgi:hypothetical protein
MLRLTDQRPRAIVLSEKAQVLLALIRQRTGLSDADIALAAEALPQAASAGRGRPRRVFPEGWRASARLCGPPERDHS